MIDAQKVDASTALSADNHPFGPAATRGQAASRPDQAFIPITALSH